MLLIIGCSKSQPISPDDNENINSVPIITPSTIPDGFTATGILGSYDFTINPDDMSYELISSRSSALGQSYIVNVKSFFTITPCQDCLKIKGIAYDYPWIRADFLVSHPFEKGNTSQPPSGKNRLDLDIFDPVLIVVPLDEPPTEPHLLEMEIYSESCGFADGYTRELAEVIDKEFACPYFLIIDDSDTGISTWNRFEMGRKDQQFSGWFKGGHFELFLTFGYGISTRNYTERLNPTYYNPEFNRKAAWKVNVIPPEYGWSPDDSDDKRDVIVEVYDWQIGATVDPALVDPSSVYESSEVLGVGIEISGMTNTLQIQTVPDGSHTGCPDDPLIYIVSIANENFLPGGYYTGYVKVLDKRVPPQAPFDGQIDSLIDIPDGVTMDFVSMPEFATYQIFTAEVWTNEPPCADLDVSDYFIDSGRSIQMFPGPATDDPDGVIVRYEYDFDYQGGIFYPEASNTTGEPVTSPPFYNDGFGQITRKVAMRVVDNGTPQKSDVEVETITIYPADHDHWAVTWGGVNHEYCQDMEIDSMGNIYICGMFQDVVDFDPGSGEDYHTATYGEECFLSKFNSNGDFIWAVSWGGTSPMGEWVGGLAVDNNDNIYVTGRFAETMDFDPGPDETIRTSNGYSDVYFIKFKSDSEFQWAHTWGGDLSETGISVCTDSFSNVYVSGRFYSSVDFDPTDAIDIHSANKDKHDAFLCKYDVNGNYLWTVNFTEPPVTYDGSIDNCICDVDMSANIYLAGRFGGYIDFDPSPLSEHWHNVTTGSDAYLVKLNQDGNYLWSKSWGNPTMSGDEYCWNLATLNSDYVYVVGTVDRDLDLDPGPGEDFKTAFGSYDIFISKFNSNGDYMWGHVIGGTGDDRGTDIAVTSEDNVYISGYFEYQVDFNPFIGIDKRITHGDTDIFTTKFASDGSYTGTITLGGTGYDQGSCIALADNDNLFISGRFSESVDFDPTSYGTDYHTSNGYTDIFLCRP